MEAIVDWLIEVEKLAGDFYFEATDYFKGETDLNGFLKAATEDEAWHFHIMGSAKAQMSARGVRTADYHITEETRQRIEKPFRVNIDRLKSGTITKENLLECVAETEYSEWNKIFLYAVNSLKEEFHQFRIAAAKIQGHLGRIERFLKKTPYGIEKLKEFARLETVFTENILVLEDNDINLELMCSLLEDVGNVDGAVNGIEGLEKLKTKYYKLIVSDINMPEMDGIAFYKKAVQEYPNLQNRFLFTTGFLDNESRKFFRERGITVLQKPCDIDDILEASDDILHLP